MTEPDVSTQLQALTNEIHDKVKEFSIECAQTVGRPKWATVNPEKAVEALTMLSTGCSIRQTAFAAETQRSVIAKLRSDFSDYLGQWKEVGGQVSGGLYFESSEYVSELLDDLTEARANKDWDAVKALSAALASTNKVVDVANRHAMTARS